MNRIECNRLPACCLELVNRLEVRSTFIGNDVESLQGNLSKVGGRCRVDGSSGRVRLSIPRNLRSINWVDRSTVVLYSPLEDRGAIGLCLDDGLFTGDLHCWRCHDGNTL